MLCSRMKEDQPIFHILLVDWNSKTHMHNGLLRQLLWFEHLIVWNSNLFVAT